MAKGQHLIYILHNKVLSHVYLLNNGNDNAKYTRHMIVTKFSQFWGIGKGQVQPVTHVTTKFI